MLAISDISNKLTFDLLTLKVVSESRVTRATSVPNLVFLGLSVLDLRPMYVTDIQTDVRQTDIRQKHRLMPPPIRGGGIIMVTDRAQHCASESTISSVCRSLAYPVFLCHSCASDWLKSMQTCSQVLTVRVQVQVLASQVQVQVLNLRVQVQVRDSMSQPVFFGNFKKFSIVILI